MVAETLPRLDYTAWLSSVAVVRRDGAVMSWVNAEHPGYPYPEIAGYLLSYLSLDGRMTAPLRNRVALHLLSDLTASGAVGRRGIEYVFDSAMVLGGLLAHEANGGLIPDPRMVDRLRQYVVERLTNRIGLDGTLENAATHWSQSYGCHLLKCVISLTAFDVARGSDTSDLVAQLLDDLLPLYEGAGDVGRFHVNAGSDVTYAHAHCYALEGLLVLEGRGRADLRRWIDGGAAWLAEVQQAHGGVPAEHDSNGARMGAHADCTAQAIRIWACADYARFRANIERGLEFLDELSDSGGIRYETGSNDINTWATIFGAQALDFAAQGGNWKCLI